MKNPIKLYVALFTVALLSISGPGYAQKKKDTLPYGYGHTIELSGGPAYTIGSRYPNTLKTAWSDGGIFNMRYSYFFGKHFGAYAGLNIESVSLCNDKYFGKLDNSYTYKAAYQANNIRESYSGVSLGGVYRYDFGRWSLRPRLGIGYTSYSTENFEYYRYARGNSVTYEDSPEHVYIIYPDNSMDCLSVEASVQICFTVGTHFFFLAEAGGMAVPGKIEERHEIYETRTPAPTSWNEALLGTNLDRHINTIQISDKTYSHSVSNLIYVKLGIGWNIGFNRNINKKYNR